MVELKGVCKYCGQACVLPMREYESKEAKDEAATNICSCDEARLDRMLNNAYSKIAEIFLTECCDIGLKAISEDQVEILKESARAVAEDVALSITVSFRNGIKAVIKGNSKGELEISRTDTTALKKSADDK